MHILDYKNFKDVFVVGDIHGEFKQLFNHIKHNFRLQNTNNSNQENTLIIVCGDCGLGFNKLQYYIDIFTSVNEFFRKNNTVLLFVRGNHDDPSYFTEDRLGLSNIKTVQDYSVIMTQTHNILCVGGAYSCDRIWRKREEIRLNRYKTNKSKKLYWENEEVVLDIPSLEEITHNNIQIDMVVTHTAPTFAYPNDNQDFEEWFSIDADLRNDIISERQILFNIYEYLLSKNHPLKLWAYGHFHREHINTHKDIIFLALSNNLSLISVESILNRSSRKKKTPFGVTMEPLVWFDLNTIQNNNANN